MAAARTRVSVFFFFSSRRRHTRLVSDWSSDVCSSDLMSNVTALLADGRPYHEAGAGEAQELAAMLATLVAYLRACEAAGVRPRTSFPKIALALAADADLFLTIAKLRATRKLAARIAEACGASHAADRMPLWAATSERMMAKR